MRHELKTDPIPFQAVWDGDKLYEIRKDDREYIHTEGGPPSYKTPFVVGEELLLRETKFSGAQMSGGRHLEYTGREVLCLVTHKLAGSYGILEGWCILGIKRLDLIVRRDLPSPTHLLPEQPEEFANRWPSESAAPEMTLSGLLPSVLKEAPKAARRVGDNKSGGQVTYYSVDVDDPSKGGEPYHAECIDIINALDMNFSEGEAFKSIWRCAADRHPGLEKAGNETVRDAQKVAYYGGQMERLEKRRHGRMAPK